MAVRHIFSLGNRAGLASLRDLAREVESSGADALVLEERRDSELEPVVTLAALSERTRAIALAMMVSVQSGRPPGVLAKLLSGLDLVSGGRGRLVLDARAATADAGLACVEEQAGLIAQMLANDVTTHHGPCFRVDAAWNTPRVTHIPPALDRVSIACSPEEYLRPDGPAISSATPRIVVLDRTAGEAGGPILATVPGRAHAAAALVEVDEDIEASLAFAASISSRYRAIYLRWSELPTPAELAQCTWIG